MNVEVKGMGDPWARHRLLAAYEAFDCRNGREHDRHG